MLGDLSWPSSGNHFAWFPSGAATPTDSYPDGATSAESSLDRSVADDKPELLPWRSRLRGYRLGARLARGRESDHDGHLDQTIAYSSAHETTQKPRPSVASTDDRPTPSLENGELNLPASVGLLPDRGRPDLIAR